MVAMGDTMAKHDKSIRLTKKNITIWGLGTLFLYFVVWDLGIKPYVSKKITDLMETKEKDASEFAQEGLLSFLNFIQGIPLGWLLLGVIIGIWISTYFDTEIQPDRVERVYSEETVKNIRQARKILGDMASQADVVKGSLDYSGQSCKLCGNATKLQTIASTLPTEEMRFIAASMQKLHKRMHKLQGKFIKLIAPDGLTKVESGFKPNGEVKMDGNASFKARKYFISSQENRLFAEIGKKQKRFWALTEEFAD